MSSPGSAIGILSVKTIKAGKESILDIYVINLDKDVERLRWMQEQLRARQLEFTRIAAVDGAQIHAEKHPFWANSRRSHLGVAETGCLLSHISAWRLLAAHADSDHGLVLEDDLHVSEDFGSLLGSMALDPNEFCVHRLETFRANVTLTRRASYVARGRRAHKLETNHGGAGAYILSKQTASRLLTYVDRFRAAVDIELFDPKRRTIKDLRIYQWIPAPCVQDFLLGNSHLQQKFASNIGRDRADVRSYFSKPSQRLTKLLKLLKSKLRILYTRFYSISLLPRGRMRRRVEFA